MSSLTTLAEMIPAEYRKEILETNMIGRAQAISSDASMLYLFTIWKNYIEPDENLNMACGFCLERILKNWKGLQDEMVRMEREEKLLGSL
jgi:hypothetical protein